MGFLRNTAESVMILAVSGGFGIYIGLGLLALVVALTVMGTTGVSVGPVLVLAAIGLGMLVIGGVSLAAIWKQSWAWLVIVNIVMLGVLVVTVCVSLVVLALALNVQDPVVEAVDRTWDSDSDPGGATRRELDTNKAFCEIRNGLPVHDRCESFYDMLHAAVAQDGCPLEAVDISSNCSAIEPETAEIEVFSFCKPDNAAGTGIPLSGQSLQHWRRQFYTACKGCSHDCKEEFIANVKVQLEPAAIAAICTFFFIVVTVFWNHFAVLEKAVRVDHELKRVYMRVEGIRLQGAMALNIIVGVAGLILLVLGYVSNNDAAELCPTGVECSPTYATVVLCVGGFLLIGVMAIAIFGLFKTDSAVLINLLRGAQLAYIVLGSLLLLAAIVFAISSGILDAVFTSYERDWESLRSSVEEVHPEYCRYGIDQPHQDWKHGERSWRSMCLTRMECSRLEKAQGNCAWDEVMYGVLHVPDSAIPACSTRDKPVRQHSSLCKELRDLVRLQPAVLLPAIFRNVTETCARPGERDVLICEDPEQRVLYQALTECAAAVRQTFDLAVNRQCLFETAAQVVDGGFTVTDYRAAAELDLFDCRRCTYDQEFIGAGASLDALECTDDDFEVEVLLSSSATKCSEVAAHGLCKWPVRALAPEFDGAVEGDRLLEHFCQCSCLDQPCVDTITEQDNLASVPKLDLVFNATENSCASFIARYNRSSCGRLAATVMDEIAASLAEEGDALGAALVSKWNQTLAAAAMQMMPVSQWCPVTCAACPSASPINTSLITQEVGCFLAVAEYVDDTAECKRSTAASYEQFCLGPEQSQSSTEEAECIGQSICGMTDSDCQTRLKEETEANLLLVGMLAAGACGFQAGIIYLTARVVRFFKVKQNGFGAVVIVDDKDAGQTANPLASGGGGAGDET